MVVAYLPHAWGLLGCAPAGVPRGEQVGRAEWAGRVQGTKTTRRVIRAPRYRGAGGMRPPPHGGRCRSCQGAAPLPSPHGTPPPPSSPHLPGPSCPLIPPLPAPLRYPWSSIHQSQPILLLPLPPPLGCARVCSPSPSWLPISISAPCLDSIKQYAVPLLVPIHTSHR